MIVVDASVALAWVLDDSEEAHRYAASVALARHAGQPLVAPTVLTAECSYRLLKAGRAGRWGGALIEERAEIIGLFGVELRPFELSLAAQVRFAIRHHVQGYDALYLALALKQKAALATLDLRFRNAARTAGAKLWE